MLLADIVSGEVDWADFFFLVAVILGIIAAVIFFTPKNIGMVLLSLAVAFVAAGFLVL